MYKHSNFGNILQYSINIWPISTSLLGDLGLDIGAFGRWLRQSLLGHRVLHIVVRPLVGRVILGHLVRVGRVRQLGA